MGKQFLGYIVTWHCTDKDRKRARSYAANSEPTAYVRLTSSTTITKNAIFKNKANAIKQYNIWKNKMIKHYGGLNQFISLGGDTGADCTNMVVNGIQTEVVEIVETMIDDNYRTLTGQHWIQ